MSNGRRMVASDHTYGETNHFIPTPPWATRALFEYVYPQYKIDAKHPDRLWLDPCVGEWHMANVIMEYGPDKLRVQGMDIESYGHSETVLRSYLDSDTRFDHILMNPPFKLANKFVEKALGESRKTVAVHIRSGWLHGGTRYRNIFGDNPPTQIAYFASRIPAAAGRVVRKKSVFMDHVWMVWDKRDPTPRAPLWVPPNAQSLLEKDEDYPDESK